MAWLCGRILAAWAIWAGNTRGGIAMIFAVSLPGLLAVVGLASDYAMLTKIRNDLQAAADAAAIAGAREIPVAKPNEGQVASAAMSFAAYELTGDSAASKTNLAASSITVSAKVVDEFSAVSVDITEAWSPFFAHFIKSDVTPVTVTAKARFVGRNNICVLGLAGSNTAVSIDNDARLTGNNCGVFSNSTDSAGLKIGKNALLQTSITCSAGGASVSGPSLVNPTPITDCPAVDDPLKSRLGPAVGSCDHTDMALKDETKTIDPGVYCGGLKIDGNSVITFNPGVYVIKDGGLTVKGTASISGDGVGFYITGDKAQKTEFGQKSHISLVAPANGSLAGLLFFEDRGLSKKLKHKITSDDARVLLGTIYFPVGDLVVDAKNPVADQSAYTAIIVQHLELNMGPNLILNSDYTTSDVPVPAGIAGSSQVILSN